MADIPEYQQGSLPSSALGTPGVDTSPTKISEAVGGAAETALKVALKKKEIRDITAATARSSSYDYKLQRLQAENELNSNGLTPDEQATAFETSAEKLRQEEAKSATSDYERALFNSDAYKSISTYKAKAYDSGQKRITAEIVNNITTSLNENAHSVSATFQNQGLTEKEKLNVLGNAKALMLKTVENAKLVYGSTEYKKLKDETPKMLAKAAILGQMQASADDALKLVESGIFNDALNEEELQTLQAKAVAFKNRQKAYDDNARIASERANLVRVTGSFLNKELTLPKLEEEVTAGNITPEAAGALELALFNPAEWNKFSTAKNQEGNPKNVPTAGGRIIANSLYNLDPQKIVPDAGKEKSEKDIFSETLIQAIDAYNNKQIDKNDLAFIMNTADKAMNPTPENVSFLDQMKQAVNMVRENIGYAGLTQFISRWVDGTDPRDTARDMIRGKQKETNPRLALTDQTPTSIVDAFGLIKRLWQGDEAYNAAEDQGTDNATDE